MCMTIKCKRCGVMVDNARTNQRYCAKCSKITRENIIKNYHAEHRNELIVRCKAWREKTKQLEKSLKTKSKMAGVTI